MKYLTIAGYQTNTEKNYSRIWGLKIKNDFKSSVGKEQDEIFVSTNLLVPKETDLGGTLDVEFNKTGYVIGARIYK